MSKKVWVVLFSIMFIGNCVLGYCLQQERKWSNIYFHHMMEAEDGVGKPILVEKLPDGDYVRLDTVDMSADKYVFLRQQSGGNETVVGVVSMSWSVPKRFAWKDGRLIAIGQN
jgi:hypothetical protein